SCGTPETGASGVTVTVDELRYEDLARCAELERALFAGDDPWTERMLAAELVAGNHYVGAWTDGDKLVGYAGMSLLGRKPRAEAEVHTIGVDPAVQGGGVGTALLRVLLARADAEQAPVYLEVRTDNVPAIALYTAHGFEQVGLRRKYYRQSGADAYTMARPARRSS
ncbi:MAG: ribosomal protein S18-alanine N-acetyltransferase, partial [Nocardioidaceae bacterium]